MVGRVAEAEQLLSDTMAQCSNVGTCSNVGASVSQAYVAALMTELQYNHQPAIC